MATLSTLYVNANSVNGPRNWGGQEYVQIDETGASDSQRIFGLSNATANVTSFLIQDMPTDFLNMTTFNVTINAARSSTTDDTLQLQVRIVRESDGAILAAADSAGNWITPIVYGRDGNINGTGATFNTYGPASFSYVNTSATKTDWDNARVELRQNYQASMGQDGTAYMVVEWIRFGGTYALVTPNAPTGLTAGTPTATTVPLTWTAPVGGETPTGYEFRTKVSGTVPELVIGSSSNKTFSLGGGEVIRQSFVPIHSTLSSILIQSLNNSASAATIRVRDLAENVLSEGGIASGSGTNRTYTLPSTIALTGGQTYWIEFAAEIFGFDINGYSINVYDGGNAQLNGVNLTQEVSITINPGGAPGSWSAWTSTGLGTSTSYTVASLTASTTYDFQVRTTGSSGSSSSESNTATATTASGESTDSNPMQLRPLPRTRQAVARSSGW